MMWQSVDGCGISDVLVTAQHRFQAQHFCLPCQPLRLKVCLCPSISSAFSLGLQQRSSLDFTGQCNEWQQTEDWWWKCQKKKALIFVSSGQYPEESFRFVLGALSTASLFLLAFRLRRSQAPFAPMDFSGADLQQLAHYFLAKNPTLWSNRDLCDGAACKEVHCKMGCGILWPRHQLHGLLYKSCVALFYSDFHLLEILLLRSPNTYIPVYFLKTIIHTMSTCEILISVFLNSVKYKNSLKLNTDKHFIWAWKCLQTLLHPSFCFPRAQEDEAQPCWVQAESSMKVPWKFCVTEPSLVF